MGRCKNNAVKEPKAHSLEQAVDVLVEKFPLHLNPEQTLLARSLQMEAAKVWNAACNIHRTIYGRYGYWLSEGSIKALLKGKYGLHSQSVQAVVETYFECCERTRELHLQGHTEWKYPYRRKRFFTVTWKKAAITHKHILHAISANAVRWCLGRSVKTAYIGNPEEVRERDCGRHHNQRMGQWALGKLRDLLAYKLKRHGIELIPVDERGTSGTCPVCGEYTRQTGRVYRCGNASCGFTGIHRDVLGASGILDKAQHGSFTRGRKLPGKVEYLRPQVLAPKRAA